MNVFVELLSEEDGARTPRLSRKTIDIEDNVGEAIHVHLWNLRLEFTVRDFIHWATELERAGERLRDGDSN